nr:MAG: Mannosyl-glycoprotein endo-beta-N-acetylglucosaminidase [Bacteriophage sp.]
MKVIPKLQQGNTIESDNTKVVRPEIHEPIKAKPRQYSIVDLGGEPSNDTRSAAERNRDYWHPIKGAKARFKASMSNETNPLVGIERTVLPSAAGAALVTTPAAVVGGALGNMTVDKLTGGWGEWLEKTFDNNNGLINKNHWIFNKEARTPSNIAMATANRITPFLSKIEKLPLKVAAYKAAKRTNGNASVSLQDIKTMPADYTGSSILGGGNLEGRNLLAKYIFDENPVVKRMFFNKATSNIKPISRNEAEPVMRMGDKEFMTFRQPGTDYIGPIDDVAGHLVKFQMNKGKLRQTSQGMWKFNPADYAKRWNDSPNTANQVRLIKQAALMDKVGRPFILQQSNPIWIEGKSVRNPELVTMEHGGRFDFKKSPLLKKQEEINGKRDMRKKFIKSSRPTYKKRIKKAQQGMKFVSYNPVSNPTIDYTDITNPINPFSEYNYNTTYDKPEALVVPVRDTEETDVVANNPTVEPVINKPVASKSVTDKPVTKTANSTWKSPYTNRKQWSTELINAYKKAGITNDNAIRMLLAQDALESSWGKSAQGKYNFGNLTTGSSWKGDYVTGNDKNAKGEAIKQKFRSYNSMDEYAADKVQFLKRLYDFDENDDINKFVAKLTGSNKGKRRYAEATNYAKVLTGVYNGIPKGENGMIIKYQNPAQPIKYMGGYDKRGNIVLPVTNENGMNNVTLPEVTVTPRNINLAGAVDRGRRTVGNMGKEILSATAPLGDIESAKDIYQDARSGNYGQAALGAGLLLLPNFIEKPLKALKRVGKKVVKAANKYPAKNLEVNLNPDRSWNMDKIHSDVDKGTKEAIDFLESDVKKETDLYNKRLAKRLGYEHFTPYPNGAERARVKVTPDYETITYPNGEFAGRVAFDADPSKDILQYNKHYNLHPTAYHETLHRGYYGMADKDRMPIGGNLFEHVKRKANTTDFYDFKTRKLLVPENEAPDLETYNYLLIEGETAANTMELGKRLGLQPGQEYPGRQALEQMLKEFSESGNEHAFITKYLNIKHPKRVWNALTGKYFVYPLIGTTLIGGMNYDRNE